MKYVKCYKCNEFSMLSITCSNIVPSFCIVECISTTHMNTVLTLSLLSVLSITHMHIVPMFLIVNCVKYNTHQHCFEVFHC